MKKWYYQTSGLVFIGFYYLDTKDDCTYDGIGPFNTFGQAKKDAISRFNCDLCDVKNSLKKIRKCKNEKRK